MRNYGYYGAVFQAAFTIQQVCFIIEGKDLSITRLSHSLYNVRLLFLQDVIEHCVKFRHQLL